MMKTTTCRALRSSRPHRHAQLSLVSTIRLGLAAVLLAGGCDLDDPLEAEPEADELSFRATGFGKVLRDMANAAASGYGTPDQGKVHDKITINGLEHTRSPHLTNNTDGVQVSVFEYQTCQSASIVVSFRGTQIPNFCDLRDDATGATEAVLDPKNPWDESIMIDDTATVGKGFYRRVQSYMDSEEGETLRNYLDRLKDNNQKVNIHVVGHSLGGVSSAIFSQFLAQYARSRQFPKDRFRTFNFAFNSPLGMNGPFRDNSNLGFYGLANQGWLTPFGFNVQGDVVSDFNFLGWSKTYDPSKTTTGPGGDSYEPFAQLTLPGVFNPLDKHKLDENIEHWVQAVDNRGDMLKAYAPFTVNGLPAKNDSCGCDTYIEKTCPL